MIKLLKIISLFSKITIMLFFLKHQTKLLGNENEYKMLSNNQFIAANNDTFELIEFEGEKFKVYSNGKYEKIKKDTAPISASSENLEIELTTDKVLEYISVNNENELKYNRKIKNKKCFGEGVVEGITQTFGEGFIRLKGGRTIKISSSDIKNLDKAIELKKGSYIKFNGTIGNVDIFGREIFIENASFEFIR